MIAVLARIPNLRVIAPTSAFAFKNSNAGVRRNRRMRCSGNDTSRIAMGTLFRGGPPCPRGVASYVDIRVSRYMDVFVASGKQRGASNGTNREKSGSSFDKPLR